MTRTRALTLAGATIAAALALTGAQRPTVLGQAAPGMWEVSGSPDSKAPVKMCVANVALLTRFEHRSDRCSARVISSSASSMLVDYSCGEAGFGRSQIDLITPRSLRIQTQGISQQLPFNYVLQARRVGDCPAPATASRH